MHYLSSEQTHSTGSKDCTNAERVHGKNQMKLRPAEKGQSVKKKKMEFAEAERSYVDQKNHGRRENGRKIGSQAHQAKRGGA